MFSSAKQAEIVRSNQKDSFYLGYIKGALADITQTLLGPTTWMRWRKEIDVVAGLGYFGLTTLAGFQTLGEEYVNIVQVDSSKRAIPSHWMRAAMILLQVGTPYIIDKLLLKLEHQLRHSSHPGLRPEARATLLHGISVMRHAITILQRCHLAVFYLRGVYYHIAKRMMGITYIMVRHQGGSEARVSYRVLGWLSVVQLAFLFTQQLYKLMYRYRQADPGSITMPEEQTVATPVAESGDGSGFIEPSRKCPLCLEARKHSTATPCGHMFCWVCITEWAANKSECPLCRETFELSRLMPLQNYDPL